MKVRPEVARDSGAMKLAGNLAPRLALKLCLNSADDEFVGMPTTTALLDVRGAGCQPAFLAAQASMSAILKYVLQFGGAV